MRTVTQSFDHAAPSYDQAASVQAEVAKELVALAPITAPQRILDLGCGTGFVAEAARRKWPRAAITAFDVSPAMLHAAQSKIPELKIISGNAADAQFPPAFDLVFSSMLLQWLPDVRAALERWQGWLKPGGSLYVALPVAGSFDEWRKTCRDENVKDGLWPLPPATFADDLAAYKDVQPVKIFYSSAREFLQRLKMIGASTPFPGHRPAHASAMRRVLAQAPRPFPVTYRILYLKLIARDSGQNL